MLAPILQPNGGLAIVTSDTVSQGTFRGIYVGGTGHVSMVGLDGNAVLFSNIPVGTYLPVGFTRVNTTGTTATLLVGVT